MKYESTWINLSKGRNSREIVSLFYTQYGFVVKA